MGKGYYLLIRINMTLRTSVATPHSTKKCFYRRKRWLTVQKWWIPSTEDPTCAGGPPLHGIDHSISSELNLDHISTLSQIKDGL
jgi:hypothetical protein